MRAAGRGRRGQALIEAALTLPWLFILLLGFYEVSLVVQSDLDLRTAVGLAAASAATAPAGDGTVANRYAQDTFVNTVKHFGLLEQVSLTCTGPYAAGDTITCTGRATLALSGTPFAEISPSLPLSETSHALISSYRAQAPPGSR
ncbi:MAG: TadE family protein [Candidatus Dormibacteraceae bacterium]